MPSFIRFVSTQLWTICVHYGKFCIYSFANTTKQVTQNETVSARANV